MPARSKSQQRLFGWLHAIQKGDAEGPARLKELAERIPKDSVLHFAETPHKGLPESKNKDKKAKKEEKATEKSAAYVLGFKDAIEEAITRLSAQKSHLRGYFPPF